MAGLVDPMLYRFIGPLGEVMEVMAGSYPDACAELIHKMGWQTEYDAHFSNKISM